MDINYFLLLRDKYNNILSYIDSIIDEFDGTIEFTEDYLKDTDNNTFLDIKMNKDFFLERKKHILYLKNLCNEYIEKICNHVFIEDVIDISPDESKAISYCKLCE